MSMRNMDLCRCRHRRDNHNANKGNCNKCNCNTFSRDIELIIN